MNVSSDIAPIFGGIFIIFMIFFALFMTIIQIVAFCKIFSKAGFNWALGLLMLVPIANIVMFFYLAFAEWPIQRELSSYKQQNPMA